MVSRFHLCLVNIICFDVTSFPVPETLTASRPCSENSSIILQNVSIRQHLAHPFIAHGNEITYRRIIIREFMSFKGVFTV